MPSRTRPRPTCSSTRTIRSTGCRGATRRSVARASATSRCARARGPRLLLWRGSPACHWCHVMERESFEDPEIAQLMNTLFVPVKVDREERPDVDAIYMDALQAMTGSGGWALNAFITPDGVPFYAGTYFPPRPRQGMPSWPQVLAGVSEAWRTRREEIVANARQIIPRLAGAAEIDGRAGELAGEALAQAVSVTRRS